MTRYTECSVAYNICIDLLVFMIISKASVKEQKIANCVTCQMKIKVCLPPIYFKEFLYNIVWLFSDIIHFRINVGRVYMFFCLFCFCLIM